MITRIVSSIGSNVGARVLWLAAAGTTSAVAADVSFPVDGGDIDRSNTVRVTTFSDVLGGVTPAVVSVFPARLLEPGDDGEGEDDVLRRFFGRGDEEGGGEGGEGGSRPQGVGSGVIVSEDGFILTNSHVVHLPSGKLADDITVERVDRRRFKASLVGVDPPTDLAVLKIEGAGFAHLRMADSDRVQVGDLVFAVGNPFKVGLTATMGMVSATDRTGLGITGPGGYESFIQTDASINPGNSGGALVDAAGRLVGINTAIYSAGGAGNVGIGFAIPVNLARAIALRLIEKGEVVRGFAGVKTRSVDDAEARRLGLDEIAGVIVEDVLEGGPGDAAGLREGDVILAADGRRLRDEGAFRLAVSLVDPGTEIRFRVRHDGELRDVVLTVASRDAEGSESAVFPLPALDGVRIRETPDGLAIVDVKEGSPFAGRLEAGMVIVEINDDPVENLASASESFRSGVNKVVVQDGERTKTLALRVD